ncbi:AAA family ATPase [Anaeromicropila herbilytica]|uniref:ATPase n=1 Tax=Anaeromicropila herbilytica TaxID=2785025 RepID=A0A7R7IE06_9FIRM|nr:MoxR family ATPase [Anaeromicropila herbilytica]BCN32122.1 ATPase [Anaeromicropila herbilytica]
MLENNAALIIKEVKKNVIGKDGVIRKVLCALLAHGHILIEDIPGLGKTTMAMAFSKAMGLKAGRMQFTPDVLPSDLVGFHMFDKDTGEMKFHPGAVFCNLFLADEINRTSPKTQSALLEVMEEGKVTIDGVTRKLKEPFIVLATQNPSGSIGTQMLPESQLDRFMIKLSMGYPDAIDEVEILKSKRNNQAEVHAVITQDIFLEMQKEVEQVFIHDNVYSYIVNLIKETREHSFIELGASPRASVALTRMSSAYAWLLGRDYVIPEDVAAVFQDVVSHRILLNSKARIKYITKEQIITQILENVKKPNTRTKVNALRNADMIRNTDKVRNEDTIRTANGFGHYK